MSDETPLEDFYIESISPKIREFLKNRGLNVIPQEISRQKEKITPYDRLYNLGFKLFGLQFKGPKLEKGEVYWERDETQHSTLRNFDWIFYALPYFIDRRDTDNGLYLVKILQTSGFKNPRVYYSKKLGMDWGAFITEVFECRLGMRIQGTTRISYRPDKKSQIIQDFIGIIGKYQIEYTEEQKIVLEPGYSYLILIALDLEKKEFERYHYIYPDEILKKFEFTK